MATHKHKHTHKQANIERYSGRVDTFQHENRATLMFAIKKKQTTATNSDNSRESSRNNSLERRFTRAHDHLKPKHQTDRVG